MAEQPAIGRNRGKPRSPSYPGIALDEALTRARVLYRQEGRNAAPVAAVFGHWGHKPHSGAGGVVLAALKKFGLLEDLGSGPNREARLTASALAILLDEREDSPERLVAIQHAALRPALHKEVWDQYHANLPSDATLKFWLQTKKNFTETGVAEFIPQLKRTFLYAKLGQTANLTPDDVPAMPPQEQAGMSLPPALASSSPVSLPLPGQAIPLPAPLKAGMRTIYLPADPNGSGWATLEVPTPMTEEGWSLMMSVLQSMKLGLVPRPRAKDHGD